MGSIVHERIPNSKSSNSSNAVWRAELFVPLSLTQIGNKSCCTSILSTERMQHLSVNNTAVLKGRDHKSFSSLQKIQPEISLFLLLIHKLWLIIKTFCRPIFKLFKNHNTLVKSLSGSAFSRMQEYVYLILRLNSSAFQSSRSLHIAIPHALLDYLLILLI